MIIYGIKNCNTMQKAFDILDNNGAQYAFHDYKKQGITEDILREWFKKEPWIKFVNKQGLTWKKMDPEKQATLKDEDSAVSLMLENTSMIRRPIIDTGKMLIFGIDENSILESI